MYRTLRPTCGAEVGGLQSEAGGERDAILDRGDSQEALLGHIFGHIGQTALVMYVCITRTLAVGEGVIRASV